MLKIAFSPLLALALVGAGSTGCVPHNPPVVPIPGVTIGHVTQALLVRNATTSPLILLPSLRFPSDPKITLAPGRSQRLEFAVTEEQNVGDNAVSEIVLDETKTSHYLRQPETDLVLRARFGSESRTKEIRIGLGKCLLHEQPPAGGRPVNVNRQPEPGVPFVRLCPE